MSDLVHHNFIQLSQATSLPGKIGLILGGLPEDSDNLPSILFITLYAALFVPIVWRIQKHMLTFGQLWKPLLVVLLRIATFALRIKLADGNEWSKNIFVTQLIMLRLGPVILTSALCVLLRDAVLPYLPPVEAPNVTVTVLLKHCVRLLDLATYFVFGLTIAISFDVKAAINGSQDARAKMHTSKEITIWTLAAIDACVLILSIVPLVRLYQRKFVPRLVVTVKREESKFLAIMAVTLFLFVVSAFKACQLQAHGRYESRYARVVNKKILFYCVCCAGEYVACLLLVILPWARIVPPPELLEAYCRIMNKREGEGSATTMPPPANVWPAPPQPDITSTNPAVTYQQLPYVARQGEAGTEMQRGGNEGLAHDDSEQPGVRRLILPGDFARRTEPHAVTGPHDTDGMHEIDLGSRHGHSSMDVAMPTVDVGPAGVRGQLGYAKRASLNSLSTISEVGDDVSHVRSVYRNSVRHPSGSARPVTLLGGGQVGSGVGQGDGGETKDGKAMASTKGPTKAVSFEDLQRSGGGIECPGSTHAGLHGSSSQDSLTLPPNLIPSRPAPQPPHTPTSSRGSGQSTLHAQASPKTPVMGEGDGTATLKVVTRHIALARNGQTQADDGLTESPVHMAASSSNVQSRDAVSYDTATLPPRARQMSVCSVQSHWSDDSDANGNASDHGHTLTGHHPLSRLGSFRGRKEGKGLPSRLRSDSTATLATLASNSAKDVEWD